MMCPSGRVCGPPQRALNNGPTRARRPDLGPPRAPARDKLRQLTSTSSERASGQVGGLLLVRANFAPLLIAAAEEALWGRCGGAQSAQLGALCEAPLGQS